METDRQAPPAAAGTTTETTGTTSGTAASATAGAPQEAAPRRGRPRSEAAEQAICAAVEKLMTDGASLGDLTIEGIARVAGVGKATIYRRWPNRDALLVDVVFRMNDPDPQLAGVSAREDLIVLVDSMRRRGLAKQSTWWVMTAFNQLHSLPELKEAYFERVIKRRRQIISEVAARGMATGEFRGDLDPELLGELLVGPMLVRTVLWNDSQLDDPNLSAFMVDALLEGLGGPAHIARPGRSLSRRNPV